MSYFKMSKITLTIFLCFIFLLMTGCSMQLNNKRVDNYKQAVENIQKAMTGQSYESKFSVPGESMMDTIMPNAVVTSDSRSYAKQLPERFDIIIFKFPNDPSRTFIRRIIGLPGETVSIRGGKVYINDATEPLNEDYVKDTPSEGNFGPYSVPENSYFLLGDNRNNSDDSRFYGSVKREDILGKVVSWKNP